jgi:hypothetical protein
MTAFALHYGVVVDDPSRTPTFLGHHDASTELPFTIAGLQGYVSGSWACWGPADQRTDGDNSLHVVMLVDAADDEEAAGIADDLRVPLWLNIGGGARLLDYVVLSDGDAWSEGQAIILRGGTLQYIAVPQV